MDQKHPLLYHITYIESTSPVCSSLYSSIARVDLKHRSIITCQYALTQWHSVVVEEIYYENGMLLGYYNDDMS